MASSVRWPLVLRNRAVGQGSGSNSMPEIRWTSQIRAYVDAASAVQGFAHAHGLYRKTANPSTPYRNGRIVKSYVSGVLSPKKLWNASRADFNLAKVPALAGGSPETSIVTSWGPFRSRASFCAAVDLREDRMPKPSDKKTKRNTKTIKTRTSVVGPLQVWEDDPSTGVEVSLDSRPDPSATPLAYRFPKPAPKPSDDNTSFAFRYWSAAAALRRGADFGRRECRRANGNLDPCCLSCSTMVKTSTPSTIGRRSPFFTALRPMAWCSPAQVLTSSAMKWATPFWIP